MLIAKPMSTCLNAIQGYRYFKLAVTITTLVYT